MAQEEVKGLNSQGELLTLDGVVECCGPLLDDCVEELGDAAAETGGAATAEQVIVAKLIAGEGTSTSNIEAGNAIPQLCSAI